MREAFAHELGHTLGFDHPDSTDDRDEMGGAPYRRYGSYDGHAGNSAREQWHMRHAYQHGRGWRGKDRRHVAAPGRPSGAPVWVVD